MAQALIFTAYLMYGAYIYVRFHLSCGNIFLNFQHCNRHSKDSLPFRLLSKAYQSIHGKLLVRPIDLHLHILRNQITLQKEMFLPSSLESSQLGYTATSVLVSTQLREAIILCR